MLQYLKSPLWENQLVAVLPVRYLALLIEWSGVTHTCVRQSSLVSEVRPKTMEVFPRLLSLCICTSKSLKSSAKFYERSPNNVAYSVYVNVDNCNKSNLVSARHTMPQRPQHNCVKMSLAEPKKIHTNAQKNFQPSVQEEE